VYLGCFHNSPTCYGHETSTSQTDGETTCDGNTAPTCNVQRVLMKFCRKFGGKNCKSCTPLVWFCAQCQSHSKGQKTVNVGLAGQGLMSDGRRSTTTPPTLHGVSSVVVACLDSWAVSGDWSQAFPAIYVRRPNRCLSVLYRQNANQRRADFLSVIRSTPSTIPLTPPPNSRFCIGGPHYIFFANRSVKQNALYVFEPA